MSLLSHTVSETPVLPEIARYIPASEHPPKRGESVDLPLHLKRIEKLGIGDRYRPEEYPRFDSVVFKIIAFVKYVFNLFVDLFVSRVNRDIQEFNHLYPELLSEIEKISTSLDTLEHELDARDSNPIEYLDVFERLQALLLFQAKLTITGWENSFGNFNHIRLLENQHKKLSINFDTDEAATPPGRAKIARKEKALLKIESSLRIEYSSLQKTNKPFVIFARALAELKEKATYLIRDWESKTKEFLKKEITESKLETEDSGSQDSSSAVTRFLDAEYSRDRELGCESHSVMTFVRESLEGLEIPTRLSLIRKVHLLTRWILATDTQMRLAAASPDATMPLFWREIPRGAVLVADRAACKAINQLGNKVDVESKATLKSDRSDAALYLGNLRVLYGADVQQNSFTETTSSHKVVKRFDIKRVDPRAICAGYNVYVPNHAKFAEFSKIKNGYLTFDEHFDELVRELDETDWLDRVGTREIDGSVERLVSLIPPNRKCDAIPSSDYMPRWFTTAGAIGVLFWKHFGINIGLGSGKAPHMISPEDLSSSPYFR